MTDKEQCVADNFYKIDCKDLSTKVSLLVNDAYNKGFSRALERTKATSKAKGCDYCLNSALITTKDNDETFLILSPKNNSTICLTQRFQTNNQDMISVKSKFEINYCPMCGRQLIKEEEEKCEEFSEWR